MTFRDFPKEAKRVSLVLTMGSQEKGGQEVPLPSTGELPEGAVMTFGPCNPGVYVWTATFKSADGKTVGVARVEKPYP